MKNFDSFRSGAPEGGLRRSKHSQAEIHARRVAIAAAVFVASIADRALRQHGDLATLPECRNLTGRNGIGDFVGRARNGLNLEKHSAPGRPRDYLIPPAPWQAYKAWDWLRTHAPDELEAIAEAAEFASAAEAETEIIRRLDTEEYEAQLVAANAVPVEPDDRTELHPGEIADDRSDENVEV